MLALKGTEEDRDRYTGLAATTTLFFDSPPLKLNSDWLAVHSSKIGSQLEVTLLIKAQCMESELDLGIKRIFGEKFIFTDSLSGKIDNGLSLFIIFLSHHTSSKERSRLLNSPPLFYPHDNSAK